MASENNNRLNIAMECLRNMEAVGCTIGDLVEALAKLSEGEAFPAEAPSQKLEGVKLEKWVTDVLHELGMPAHIIGYNYVRTAVALAYENPEWVHAITKALYPQVAKEYGTTPSRVERAIRHAVEVTWDRGDLDVLKQYFGNTISLHKGKPTNSEFISLLADRLTYGG